MTPYPVIKTKIRRPKGSKDKQIQAGMRLFLVENGEIEARYRASKKISIVVGTVLQHAKDGEEIPIWLR